MLPTTAFSSCIRHYHLNNGSRVMVDSREKGNGCTACSLLQDIKMDRFAVSLTENDKIIGRQVRYARNVRFRNR